MAKVYKRLILLMLLVGAISGAVIYFTVDINTFRHLNSFKPWSLLAAVFFLAVGLYFDGTRLMHLVAISGEKISLVEAVQVVFGNYFLALLTPGAAGGAVAQVMFLRRAGVATGKATVLVVVRTILSILFLLCMLPLVFYYDPELMPWLSQGTLALGSAGIVLCIFGGILLFRTNWSHYFLIKFTKGLSNTRRRAIFAIYRDVRGAVLLLSTAPVKMLRVLLESAVSLLFLYSVVPVLVMGMGADADWLRILGRMIFLNIFLYFAPTPGGSGIAEGGFILLFSDLVPSGTVGIAAVAWRILAEYLPFSIGLYFTIRVFGRGFLTKELNK